jgi:hypothetical protein
MSDGGEIGGNSMRKSVNAKWLVAVGVVGAVGIGGTLGIVNAAGASSSPPSGITTTASSPTSAKFSFSASVNGLAASAVAVTGSGQADFTTDAVSLAVNIPAVVAKRIPGGSASPEVINAVFSGDTIYLEVPGLASKVGVPWISVALPSTVSSDVPTVFNKIAGALGDVNAIVGFAKAHHATVTSLGTSTVNGVKATGSKIVASASKKGHTHTVTASVWADSSDRLVQGTVATSGATKKGTLGLTATVDFTGYGSPVTITVPAPSQVKPIPWSVVEMLLGKAHHGSHGAWKQHPSAA